MNGADGGTRLAGLTETELLIARAAIDHAPAGMAAWNAWISTHDVRDLDDQTTPAAPFLHHTLSRSWPTAPGLDRLRGAVRHHWTRQSLATRALAMIAPSLASRGIPIVLHREATLALTDWHPPGTRPLTELDLFVTEGRLPELDGVLRDAGWAAPRPLPSPRLLPFVDGLSYFRTGQIVVRLLWHPFDPTDSDEARADFLERTEECMVGDTPVRRPDRADLFLMTLGAATREARPPLSWLIDVHRLQEGASAEDWRTMINRAAHGGVGGVVIDDARAVAAELARVTPAVAPAPLLRALAGERAAVRPVAPSILCRGIAGHWQRYRHVGEARAIPTGVAGFAAHLVRAHRWYWGTSIGSTLVRGARRWLARSDRPHGAGQPTSAAR